MATVVTAKIDINKALVNSEGNLELDFTILKNSTGSFTSADYKPLRIAIDNQTSFICKNEESSASFKINSLDYTDRGTTVSRSYDVDDTFSLETSAFNTDIDLLFVYIYSQNGATVHEVTPEYLEVVVPVYNEENLYNKILNIIKSDYKNCSTECKNNNVNSAYIINLYNGFKLALANGDYKTAIVFWNKMNNIATDTTGGCNCR